MHLKLRGRAALNPRFSRQLWSASTSRWRKGIFACTQSGVVLELSEGGIMSSSSPGNGNLALKAQKFVISQQCGTQCWEFPTVPWAGKVFQSGTAALGMQPFQSVLNEGLGK